VCVIGLSIRSLAWVVGLEKGAASCMHGMSALPLACLCTCYIYIYICYRSI